MHQTGLEKQIIVACPRIKVSPASTSPKLEPDALLHAQMDAAFFALLGSLTTAEISFHRP